MHSPSAAASTAAALALTAMLGLMAAPVVAQAPPSQQPPSQNEAPAPAPPKPYKTVTVTLPPAVADSSLDAFRKRLADVAARKDRPALAALVAKDFFWERESGNAADDKKSAIDNLARATGLDAKDESGWRLLADYAGEPSISQVGDRKDFACAPAAPGFNEEEFDALVQSTETFAGEWGYPLEAGVEVREQAKPDAKVVEKLGMHFVRVFPEDASRAAQDPMLRIVTPAGKIGYIPFASLLPLGIDQLCYKKEADEWKIAGYVGEGAVE